MKKGKKRVLRANSRQAKYFHKGIFAFFILPFFRIINNKNEKRGIGMKRTKFSTEVDTFDKFLEVVWNCEKNYLGQFIIQAEKNACPSPYSEVAYDAFLSRFVQGVRTNG